MTEADSTNKIAKIFVWLAWIIAIALLMFFFQDVLDKQYNPNNQPQVGLNSSGQAEVVLKQNRQGHYVSKGTINEFSVTFLLDTGATQVSIPAHIADKFLEYIDGAKLIAHNAKFDMKFLNFELQLINRDPISFDNVIDSLVIARNKFPGARNTLDALCKRFEVDLTKRDKHGALLDSELLADVYLELMGGAQKGLALDKEGDDDEELKKSLQNLKEVIPSRNYKLSSDTSDAHKKFITENFKENKWGY